MLADAERHRSTHKDSRQGFGRKLVSISPVRVWVALFGLVARLEI